MVSMADDVHCQCAPQDSRGKIIDIDVVQYPTYSDEPLGEFPLLQCTVRSSSLIQTGLNTVPPCFQSLFCAYVNTTQTDWDEFISYDGFAMNAVQQASTFQTPFELLHGRMSCHVNLS